ncbi:hypothetical protein [Rhizobium ruizarguesonis]|uniref:hypothetical protein n=1 Tax=Rhizobium ruizarguesonis TaxID=2081791 RepID=UPI0013DF6DFA|nr:hypothetical protein [Rhizobium ruizarguesonis]NEJ98823.1 hypothetical protein [Rhizobium ruizarguesonis]
MASVTLTPRVLQPPGCNSYTRLSPAQCISVCVFVILGLFGVAFSAAIPAFSQEKPYWLRNGATKIGSCAGNTDGKPLRVVNKDGQWVLLTGVVICKDVGSAYSYKLKFLRVQINPASRDRINRDNLNFDWLGLAVYGPDKTGRKINWMFDENRSLRGTLKKDSSSTIYFGGLEFRVDKAVFSKATNFTFYLTSEGVLYQFGLL